MYFRMNWKVKSETKIIKYNIIGNQNVLIDVPILGWNEDLSSILYLTVIKTCL